MQSHAFPGKARPNYPGMPLKSPKKYPGNGLRPYRSPQRLCPLKSGGGTFFSRASVGL